MEKMMSKKELFTAIVARAEITDEMVAKAQECLEALEKASAKAKAHTSPKDLEKQAADKALTEAILAVLSENPVTATEVFAMNIEGLKSWQKASLVLRGLVAEGKAAETTKDKKKAYTIAA